MFGGLHDGKVEHLSYLLGISDLQPPLNSTEDSRLFVMAEKVEISKKNNVHSGMRAADSGNAEVEEKRETAEKNNVKAKESEKKVRAMEENSTTETTVDADVVESA